METTDLNAFDAFKFDARLMRAIAESGYEQPTPIQAEAIPVALSGADLIGTAQTGTGKTAAFVLPILQRILTTEATAPTTETPKPRRRTSAASKKGHHRALIVTPTRELAEQINDTIKVLGKYTDIRSETIYGGVAAKPQEKALKDGVEILVACPGRLLDHLDAGLAKLDKIEVLVLDEADRMFDMGFLPSVRRILEFVNSQRQTLLFSATFPREVEELASSTLIEPQRVAIGRPQAAVTITHALYPVPLHLKKKLLLTLLRQTDAYAMLVFTRTKHRAEALARQLVKAGFKTTSLHSDRSQNQRQAALNGFKEGKYQVMVATDIAARGLDIETISHVINYDIPDTVDAYVHRIGRTGRAEREGDAFTLVTPDDGEMVRDIERALGQKIERRTVEGFDYAEPLADGNLNGQRPQQQPQQPREERRGDRRDDRRDDRRNDRRDGRYDDRRNGRLDRNNQNNQPRGPQQGGQYNQRPQQPAPVPALESTVDEDGFDDVRQPRPEVLERLHSRTHGDARRSGHLGMGNLSGNNNNQNRQGGGQRRQRRRGQGGGMFGNSNNNNNNNRGNSYGKNRGNANPNSSGSQNRRPLQRKRFG
jgi:ATP-dependent RNA helicase RhlE